MVWFIPSFIWDLLPTRATLESYVRKLDSLRENIYKHHQLVLSISGIRVEAFSPKDSATLDPIVPDTPSVSAESIEGASTSFSCPRDHESNDQECSSRSESVPLGSKSSQSNDDPYGIEEACLERKLAQSHDEDLEEITLGTNANMSQKNPVLKDVEAALQDSLSRVADLEAVNAQYLNSLVTTRGIARDAEDKVRKYKGYLTKAKSSVETLEKWLRERDTELEELQKEMIYSSTQQEECKAEFGNLRELATEIWIRMCDFELLLAAKYGESLDEDEDFLRYGNLRTRAMDTLDIPLAYTDVLANLRTEEVDDFQVNGQDRIIDEVSDEEEGIIERYPVVDDQTAVVLWTKPPFPPCGLSGNHLGSETSSVSSSKQTLPVVEGSNSSSNLDSESSDGTSSASSEEEKDEISAEDTKQQSSTDLAGIDIAASLNEAHLPVIDTSTTQRAPSTDTLSGNTEANFQTETKSAKPKMSKAQRREAAKEREAEVAANKKAGEEAQAAIQKKWKEIKRDLRK